MADWLSAFKREPVSQAQPAPVADVPLPVAAELPDAPPVDMGEARDHLASVVAIRARLLARRRAIAERADKEVSQPEPNWRLFKDLVAAERLTTQDIEALHVPVEHKPEDDPANVEAARVVVATLRARVEAARARGAAG